MHLLCLSSNHMEGLVIAVLLVCVTALLPANPENLLYFNIFNIVDEGLRGFGGTGSQSLHCPVELGGGQSLHRAPLFNVI